MNSDLKILAEDNLWKLSYHETLQFFRTDWQAGEYISDEDFQEKMQEIAKFARVMKPKAFLANTIDFDYTITPEMQEWHNNLLFPIFEEIGLRKLALLVPTDLFTQVSIQQAYDETQALQMLFFDDETEALNWLTS